MSSFKQIEKQLKPLRERLLAHEVYSHVLDLESLQIFMQCHMFAVWDFMSMLKSLQQQLSCTRVPWIPPTNQLGCRLVNEIVLGEESDEDEHGHFASHFDLYHHAMQSAGASTEQVDHFLSKLRSSGNVAESLIAAKVSQPVQAFVQQTFQVIEQGDLCSLASAFTFGREDLLPDVFERIVEKLNQKSDGKLDPFIYYLNRHIELDGDTHGPMACRLLESLCGDSETKWAAAMSAAERTLQSRLALWDGVVDCIHSEKTTPLNL